MIVGPSCYRVLQSGESFSPTYDFCGQIEGILAEPSESEAFFPPAVISDMLSKFPAGYRWLVGGEAKVWSGSGLTIPDTYFASKNNQSPPPSPSLCAHKLRVSAPSHPDGRNWDINGVYTKNKVDVR